MSYDYGMLRGPAHPDLDILLHMKNPNWRIDIMRRNQQKLEDFIETPQPAKAKQELSFDSYDDPPPKRSLPPIWKIMFLN